MKLVPKPKIILISQSPRKRNLLKSICTIPFEVADIKSVELQPKDIKDIETITAMNSFQKILFYLNKENVFQDKVLLASDTLIIVPGAKNKILGKIEDSKRKEFKRIAQEQLYFLLGKKQIAYSSVVAFDLKSGKIFMASDKTSITFKKKSKETMDIINYYINLKEEGRGPEGKAGGYGLQEPEILMLTEKVIGDPGVVIGLPLHKTIKLLKNCGIKQVRLNIKKVYEFIWGKKAWKGKPYFIPERLKEDREILKGNFVPLAFKVIH